MARKLNPQEKLRFEHSLQSRDPAAGDLSSVSSTQLLAEKRDRALDLSPELEVWFGLTFPPRSESGQ
jgi:hypothetical protein